MEKIVRYTVITVILPVLSVVFLSGFFVEPDDTPVALIKKVVKDVAYRQSETDTGWETAKAGIPLANGHEVRTGFKSLALVLFTDGSGVLRVRENSVLQIYGEKEEKTIDKNTYIDRGEVGFEVTKQEEEEFTFTTPTVVASIRGTGGYIDVDDDSTTTIMCDHGLIELQARLGTKQQSNVGGGNTAQVGTDGSIQVGPSTGDHKNRYQRSKQVDSKTIKIRTNRGILEIEYLPEPEQN